MTAEKRQKRNVFIMIFSLILLSLALIYALFGIRAYAVMSKSMEPAYLQGSILLFEETPTEDLKDGDTVFFSYRGRMICHRLIRKEKGYIVTKGDNNKEIDPKIENKEVKGKVILYIPHGIVLLVIVFAVTFFMAAKPNKEKKKNKGCNIKKK